MRTSTTRGLKFDNSVALPAQSLPARDARSEEVIRRMRSGFDIQRPAATATLELFWPWTLILADTTSGSVTLTLPPAQGCKGYTVQAKKMIAANTLTLDGNGTETIDGSLTLAWTTRYQSYLIVCDGTQWVIL